MALDLGTLWAALIAAAATMVLGFVWYGVLFEKLWLRAMGFGDLSADEKKRMQQEAVPGYAISTVGAAVTAVLLDFLVDWAQPGSPYADQHGAVVGLAVASTAFLALYVPSTLTAQFFEGRRWVAWALGVGYWGILALVTGAAVGWLS